MPRRRVFVGQAGASADAINEQNASGAATPKPSSASAAAAAAAAASLPHDSSIPLTEVKKAKHPRAHRRAADDSAAAGVVSSSSRPTARTRNFSASSISTLGKWRRTHTQQTGLDQPLLAADSLRDEGGERGFFRTQLGLPARIDVDFDAYFSIPSRDEVEAPATPSVGGIDGRVKRQQAADDVRWFLNFRAQAEGIIRFKNTLIFANALVGLIFMMVINQICWDGETCHFSGATLGLACCISGLTALLIYQLLDRKRTEVLVQKKKLMVSYRQKASRLTNRPLTFNRAEVPLSHLLDLRKGARHWGLWAQILSCLPYPFPFMHAPGRETTSGWFYNALCLFMFLRLHLGVLLIRDHNAIYISRHWLQRQKLFPVAHSLRFNWWLSVKTLTFQYPVLVFGFTLSLLTVIFGYCIYLLEREAQPELFDFAGSVFLAFIVLVTGYASDNFNKYMPSDKDTQVACITATIFGLFFISFMFGVAAESMLPSRAEKSVVHLVRRRNLRIQELNAAASLIQLVWHHHKRGCWLEQHYAQDERTYERLADEQDKRFFEKLEYKAKLFRQLSNQRAELDDALGLKPTMYSGSTSRPMYKPPTPAATPPDSVRAISDAATPSPSHARLQPELSQSELMPPTIPPLTLPSVSAPANAEDSSSSRLQHSPAHLSTASTTDAQLFQRSESSVLNESPRFHLTETSALSRHPSQTETELIQFLRRLDERLQHVSRMEQRLQEMSTMVKTLIERQQISPLPTT